MSTQVLFYCPMLLMIGPICVQRWLFCPEGEPPPDVNVVRRGISYQATPGTTRHRRDGPGWCHERERASRLIRTIPTVGRVPPKVGRNME